nr:hypothetical protein [uncultured Oscillibacter sp.]
MKRENRILLGIAVLLIVACLGDIWFRWQEKARTLAEQEAREGSVVIENLHVLSGADVWADFYQAAQAGEPAQVRLVKSYVGVGEDSACIMDLAFDGETYAVAGSQHTYRYLLCFPDVAARSGARFSSATYYILANDDTVTLEEIERYELSSFEEEPPDVYKVYTEYVWKDEP